MWQDHENSKLSLHFVSEPRVILKLLVFGASILQVQTKLSINRKGFLEGSDTLYPES